MSRRFKWLLFGGVVIAAALSVREAGRRWRTIPYGEARAVIDRRCVECHSERPTNRAFPFPPKGVKLDTAQQMKQYAKRIEASVTVERTMPIANMSNMTEDERWLLGRWVQSGAQVP